MSGTKVKRLRAPEFRMRWGRNLAGQINNVV